MLCQGALSSRLHYYLLREGDPSVHLNTFRVPGTVTGPCVGLAAGPSCPRLRSVHPWVAFSRVTFHLLTSSLCPLPHICHLKSSRQPSKGGIIVPTLQMSNWGLKFTQVVVQVMGEKPTA